MSSILKVTYLDQLDEFGVAQSSQINTDTIELRSQNLNERLQVSITAGDPPVTAPVILTGSGDDRILATDSELAFDYVNSGAGNDTLEGRAGNDTLDGGDGNDKLYGGDGTDKLDGNDGNDTLDGGVGNDSLNGSAGDDSIVGGDGNDTIIGGPGKDTVDAGAGDDVLNISTGDTVTSGTGADRINFDLAAGFDPSNPPRINDFVSGEDQIAILGQDGAKLSYDPITKKLLLDGQALIQLDANVVLNQGDLVTSTGVDIPFEATAPVTYKLSGTVYNDTNAPDKNAIEAADTPIAGVKVELFKADAAGKIVGAAIGSDTTDAKGF
ncbi:MAG: hypothetical protein RLZZ04_3688, partial [Cyanobacteriota bacterium]